MFRQSTNQNHYPVFGSEWRHWTALTAGRFRRCWEEKTTRSNRVNFRLRATMFTFMNGFPLCKHLLKETMGEKMLENDQKNVFQTCCGLCIYVPYWTSDSLFLWTSVRLSGFDRIHLTTILALEVKNWPHTLKPFIYDVGLLKTLFLYYSSPISPTSRIPLFFTTFPRCFRFFFVLR